MSQAVDYAKGDAATESNYCHTPCCRTKKEVISGRLRVNRGFLRPVTALLGASIRDIRQKVASDRASSKTRRSTRPHPIGFLQDVYLAGHVPAV